MKVSSNSSSVVKELAIVVKTMKKSSNIDFLVGEMNSAVQEFQNHLKSLPILFIPQPLQEADQKNTEPPSTRAESVPVMDIVPLITLASLLTEIASRIEGVVDAVEKLADLAEFKPMPDDKMEPNQPTKKVPDEHKEDETMKSLQRV